MNWKEFGRKRSGPNRETALEFSCRDCLKPPKTLIRISDVPAEIRTEHLSNTSHERYRQAYPFGVSYLITQLLSLLISH
jgi:hypothetical protein